MKNLLVADNLEIVRSGVKLLLRPLLKDAQLVEARNCAEILTRIRADRPIFAIMDIYYKDGSIFTLIPTILQLSPYTSILIYTEIPERVYAKRLLQMGVKGYVSKRSSMETLEEAMGKLLKGEMYVSAELQKYFFSNFKTAGQDNPLDLLSDRELQVIEYLSGGMGSKEISKLLSLDITTVSTYRRRACEKLNVTNMIELRDKFILYKNCG